MINGSENRNEERNSGLLSGCLLERKNCRNGSQCVEMIVRREKET